jgi:molybdopterin molybdotransferase
MKKDFFKVTPLDRVLDLRRVFGTAGQEAVDLEFCHGRILATDVFADRDLPDFSRSTMDGYAVAAASTFGASADNPALFQVTGTVAMGEKPDILVEHGEAVRIATGGMLPSGADSVVMVEFTEPVDEETLEVYKSVAPGQNIIEKGEDFSAKTLLLEKGKILRPQDAGLLAAFGHTTVPVFKKPVIGIVSTGDEIVPVSEDPPPGHIRDMNTHTLRGLVLESGAVPLSYGIVKDDERDLYAVCEKALAETDMVLISGGSSVGARDFTTSILTSFPNSQILVHGISISPGKPTILASVEGKAVWGLPGHVVSAMVVYDRVVKPFVRSLAGCSEDDDFIKVPAVLARNVASAQGREEYVRVRLEWNNGQWTAVPVLGKSGAISTMVLAHGLIRIPLNTEGLEKGSRVMVMVGST